MVLSKNTKKSLSLVLVFTLCCIVATFQSCKKKRSEMANILFKKTHNPVFKDFDFDEFTILFKNELEKQKLKINNAQLIANHYEENGYEPTFVINHLWNGDIDAMLDKFEKVNEHGINPNLFNPEQINALANKLQDKNSIKTTDDAYKTMAELEVLTANSLISYSNDLQYGLINPKKIYSRYFIKTQRPDTTSMNKLFYINNMKVYLDSIQPHSPDYLALQKAYLEGYEAPNLSKEETKRILLVNMERLRWKNKPTGDKYVYVNIPDFKLDVMDSGKSVLNMRVCVGQGRNKKYLNSLENYNDTCKIDNPYPRETPMLNSVIHSVQVNPIWNIPRSIATKEIIVEAAKDPFYLSNKNINVYKNNKLIENPETIDWKKVDAKKSEYMFKQQPGADNSLGKIKFLFENRSSVYLHDTPAKDAFRYAMRAVSHGCVRLEKPLDLAHTLFSDTTRYNQIAKDMTDEEPKPHDIYLRPRIPVYITYVTCWPDAENELQFRRDVYGLDIVLYENLKKYLPAE